MNKESQQLILSSFFSAYFHEDWHCEVESAEAVIDEYVKTATPGDVLSLSQAMQDYSQAFTSDSELEKKLFADLGCYYCPSAQGLSAKSWLENTANQLLRKNIK